MRTWMLALALGLAAPAVARAEKVYGQYSEELGEAVTVSELLAHPDDWVGRTVRVEGVITDVCAKRGCWIAIAGDQEFQTVRFKVRDGVIAFPPDVRGRRAVVVGTFNRYETTREQAIERARHHAAERGEEFDPSTITGPQVEYRIDGIGALVR